MPSPLAAPAAPPSPTRVAPKELSPDRPEVLIQAYLVEKATWLLENPTVRPAEYRKARKWNTPRPKVLKEQAFYMPRERCDVRTGVEIASRANWTNEEIIVWLDHRKLQEESDFTRLNAEFISNGGMHTERGSKAIWARVAEEQARDAERYIL